MSCALSLFYTVNNRSASSIPPLVTLSHSFRLLESSSGVVSQLEGILLMWARPERSGEGDQIIGSKNMDVLVWRPVILVLDGRRDLQM